MAARKTTLRSVTADEKPAKAAPKSVTLAAKVGTKRELLVAMRDRVAIDVENPNTPSRELAALTKRLMELVNDIEAIDARAEQDGDAGGEVADGTFNASAV